MEKTIVFIKVFLTVFFVLGGTSPLAMGESVTYSGVTFPLGDISFADIVIDFTPGSESGESDGSAVIGPPNGEVGPSIIGAKGDVTLGKGGSIILKFTNNFLIDGEGLDIYIYEYGPAVEPFKVEISKDGIEWIDLGVISGQPTGVDIHGKVNSGDKFSYVRLTDPASYSPQNPSEIGKELYYGADIDAVGAIGSEQRPDSDEDGIADDDDTCPNTPTGVIVDAKGCQISTDSSCTACFSAIAPESRGDIASGTVPLTIQFKDCSYSDPIAWHWNFGDGGVSFAQDPTWVYSKPGKYTATLTVTCKDGGKDTISATVEGWDTPQTSCPVSFSVAINSANPKEVILTPIVPCPHAQAIRWKYGDGFEDMYNIGLGSPSDPHYRLYSDYGTYTIIMEVIFATDTEIASQNVRISPSSTGDIPSYNSVAQITSNNLGSFTVNNAGDVYFVDYTKGTIGVIGADGTEKVVTSGIDRPRSPVFDSRGNLYVGSFDGTIQKITPDGTKTVIASGIWSPQAMGCDADDTLYVAGGYDGNIYKITKTGSITNIPSGFPNPKHLVVTQSGDMFVVNDKGSLIKKISRDGTSGNLVDLGKSIKGMTIEDQKIYVCYDDTVAMVDLNGKVTPLKTGLDQPVSISVQNGVIYVTGNSGTVMIK